MTEQQFSTPVECSFRADLRDRGTRPGTSAILARRPQYRNMFTQKRRAARLTRSRPASFRRSDSSVVVLESAFRSPIIFWISPLFDGFFERFFSARTNFDASSELSRLFFSDV